MVINENLYIFISLAVIAIYVLLIISGYKHGFIYELVSMLYTAIALALAWFMSPVLADLFPLVDLSTMDGQLKLLNELFALNSMINTVIHFLLVFLVMKLLYFLIAALTKSLNNIPVIGKFNQFLGAFAGFLNATLIVLVFTMLLTTPLFKNGKDVRDHTLLKLVSDTSDKALSYVIGKVSSSDLKSEGVNLDVDAYREELKEWLLEFDFAHE